MQQLVGKLHRQPFQHFFGRRAFGKLAHGVVEHLLAGAFALVAQGASLQATDRSDVYNVLKSAVLGKNTRIVRKIHALLPDTDLNDQTLDSDGETLLMIAASNDRLETAEYLLSQGANPNLVTTIRSTGAAAYDQSALSYACTRGYGDMQKLLIAHGVINHRTGRSSCE